MILLDTNFLILCMLPGSSEDVALQRWLVGGETVRTNVMVWAEFLCGPVLPDQVRLAEALIRDPEAIIASDAAKASELFNATGRRRGTLADCIIAAICIRLNASIATNNLDDFRPFEPFGLRIEPV